MKPTKWLLTKVACAVIAMSGALVAPLASGVASAATPNTLDLNVLLIGGVTPSPTTAAWQSALSSEGVAYTLVAPSGAYGSETLTLPTLSSGTTANFDGVVFADSPFAFASGQLASLFAFESQFQIRQIDAYAYPSPLLGETDVTSGSIAGTTGALNAAGLAALPALKGPVPFDVGTLGDGATVDAGAPFTPWLTVASTSTSNVLAGVYQHPSGDAQAGVAELILNFDYNSTSLDWLLLSPGLINWVTQDTHLGLYRNYFGQDIDDTFIADNEWSSQYQCTPAATNPSDFTCPAGVANNPADTPPDVQMSAADVAYVVAWEQSTGIKLNLAFNALGACDASSVANESSANCTGSVTDGTTTYTDPGFTSDDATAPNDAAFVNALLAAQASFNWTTHTWSHQFLGCNVAQPQALTSATPNATAGTLAAGSYSYEITAATAYGESEPSAVQTATVVTNGSVTLEWPDATNGTGAAGPGPTLALEEANHTGGTGFWGYNVYRSDTPTGTFGLIGQVAEDPTGATTSYTFTDTGATTPGGSPSSTATDPTATNPGIDCSSAAGSWEAVNTGNTDSSIDTEIAWDQAFAKANGLTYYSPAVVITGEHSGIENPNMPSALAGVGVNVFATDASRQPQQYSLTSGANVAESAPRYPSNIYYNASNWADELNEYNTLYVAPGDSIGDAAYPSETGHCAASSDTTCITTPATEATLLASESSIMLSHVLNNDPRVGYAHQTDLIGPAATGYTILSLINSMLSQYSSWTTTPLEQVTDATDASTLLLQSNWASALSSGKISDSETNGVVTVTNNSTSTVTVPVTAPLGTLEGTASYGTPYGGTQSAWNTLAPGATLTLTDQVPPTITSSAPPQAIVGTPYTYTIYTTGFPAPAITEVGAMPAGLTFTDNGNGTATIAGTATGTGASYPLTVTANNGLTPNATQAFSLIVASAPSITSAATALAVQTVPFTYTVTTTGYPLPTITETGTLPTQLKFVDNGNGTATISGTIPNGTLRTYSLSISATNSSGSIATLPLVITEAKPVAPTNLTLPVADFTVNQLGSVVVSATGVPLPALTEVGAMPLGLSFTDNGNGTATISGTPASTAAGSYPITITAGNLVLPNATGTLTIVVGQAPSITNATSVATSIGTAFTFAVTTGGYPAPALGETGTLPSQVTFVDNGNGTATISGTPQTGAASSYQITITAINGTSSTQQTFTIDVSPAATTTTTTTTTLPTATTTTLPTATTTTLPVTTTTVVGGGGGGGGVAPTTPLTQAALSLTSTAGTVGTALTLTSSGGSGSGALSYKVTDPGTAGCTISGGSVSATTAGTCTVTATKAADATYKSASSTATTVTFIAAVVIPSKPPKSAPKIPNALTVKFAKASVGLQANYQKALNKLAKKLVTGAAVTVRYYTKGQAKLAKSRASATAKFLQSRTLYTVSIKLAENKQKSSPNVVVVPTKN
jgi:hypothetical protein